MMNDMTLGWPDKSRYLITELAMKWSIRYKNLVKGIDGLLRVESLMVVHAIAD